MLSSGDTAAWRACSHLPCHRSRSGTSPHEGRVEMKSGTNRVVAASSKLCNLSFHRVLRGGGEVVMRKALGCRDCHGEGSIVVHALVNGHYERKVIETCPTCGGSGQAETTEA